jgi:Tannase and feruloyl esterase
MEAQRYPDDFDGIIAGDPVLYRNEGNASSLLKFGEIANGQVEALPPSKTKLLEQAVLAQCDTLDGVKDGILEDPRKCHFDPSSLSCSAKTGDNCLTPAQIAMARLYYSPVLGQSGDLIDPGMAYGSEETWPTPPITAPPTNALDTFRYVSRQDPKWDWHTFDLDRDLDLLRKNGSFMDATDPNLTAFKAHGGKLLMYNGWNDDAAQRSILYYSSVLAEMGPNQDGWFRLFMVPGMNHCGGGPGANQFNALAALERWREAGAAPERILAVHTDGPRVV